MSWPQGGDETWELGGLSPTGSCLQDGVGDFSWRLKGGIMRLAGSSSPVPWVPEGMTFPQPEHQGGQTSC